MTTERWPGPSTKSNVFRLCAIQIGCRDLPQVRQRATHEGPKAYRRISSLRQVVEYRFSNLKTLDKVFECSVAAWRSKRTDAITMIPGLATGIMSKNVTSFYRRGMPCPPRSGYSGPRVGVANALTPLSLCISAASEATSCLSFHRLVAKMLVTQD